MLVLGRWDVDGLGENAGAQTEMPLVTRRILAEAAKVVEHGAGKEQRARRKGRVPRQERNADRIARGNIIGAIGRIKGGQRSLCRGLGAVGSDERAAGEAPRG